MSEYPQLLKLLDQYSTEEKNYAQQLLDLEKRTNSMGASMVVPVVGRQGEGKSTLINALLCEDILPSEADETTCVPVEIRFGESPSCEVFFQDDRPSVRVANKQDLSEYVDNNFNPGNEKKISRVVISRNLPLLKTGLVIVDLPGVGSLTAANEETTNRYIQNLTVALFVISTSPPILKSDAFFIQTVWREFNSAYFVQNVWYGDSEEDVQAALVHNSEILKQIAQKINVPFTNNIIPVNAYLAAKGGICDDNSLISKSNITELIDKLMTFAEHYREQQNMEFCERVRLVISELIDQIEDSIENSQMSKEELNQKLQNSLRQNSDLLSNIILLEHEIMLDLSKDRKSLCDEFSPNISKKYSELLRVHLFQLIDRGVVDGSQLTSAFNDYRIHFGEEALEEIYKKFDELKSKYSKKLDKIIELSFQANIGGSSFNKEQSFKWEKGFDAIGKIASSVGGIWIGASIFGGPVGFAVGFAISLVGGWLSGKVRHKITRDRGLVTKRELDPYIREFKDELENLIKVKYDDFCKIIFDALNVIVDQFRSKENEIKDQIYKLNADKSELNYRLDDLKNSKQYLENLREDLAC